MCTDGFVGVAGTGPGPAPLAGAPADETQREMLQRIKLDSLNVSVAVRGSGPSPGEARTCERRSLLSERLWRFRRDTPDRRASSSIRCWGLRNNRRLPRADDEKGAVGYAPVWEEPQSSFRCRLRLDADAHDSASSGRCGIM